MLIERQQLQQTKSIHELSKIRNLNELPIPGNVIKMPNVPLPKMKSILNVIARPAPRASPRRTPKSETYHSFEGTEAGTVESTPLLGEDRHNGLESPGEDRYEEITPGRTDEELPPPPQPIEEDEEEEDQFSLADQIRATPERSLKKDKKKKNRRSTDSEALSADSSVVSGRMEDEEIPPPLPPKRTISPSPKKGLSLESQPSLEEEVEAVPVKVGPRHLSMSLNCLPCSPTTGHPIPASRRWQHSRSKERDPG